MSIAPKEFELIYQGFLDPTCNELWTFSHRGLLSAQEQFQVVSNRNEIVSQGFFPDEQEDTGFIDAMFLPMMEYGFGVKGNFFVSFPSDQMLFRYWFDDNLVQSPGEVVWGEELGFYEFDDFLVSKSVMNNTHLVWAGVNEKSNIVPYVTGGVEITLLNPQITTNRDIKERFGIDLPCPTVIYSR